jgi:hypothetical protein
MSHDGLSDDQIKQLSDEAERGYNIEQVTPRPQRDPMVEVLVRLPAEMHRQLAEQAEQEQTSVSGIVRSLLSGYLAPSITVREIIEGSQ